MVSLVTHKLAGKQTNKRGSWLASLVAQIVEVQAFSGLKFL